MLIIFFLLKINHNLYDVNLDTIVCSISSTLEIFSNYKRNMFSLAGTNFESQLKKKYSSFTLKAVFHIFMLIP